MRDNAGENKSHEIIEFFKSLGMKDYFSTAYEPWQNWLPESGINSITVLSRTIMTESGLGGWFWFKSALFGCDARNAAYKERIGTTPWKLMHGAPSNASKFSVRMQSVGLSQLRETRERKAFAKGCGSDPFRIWAKHTIAYSFCIPEKNIIMPSNQGKFDELIYPYRKQKTVEQIQSDLSTNICFRTSKDAK